MWPWAKQPPPLDADGSQGLVFALIRSRPTRLGAGLLAVCLLLWIMAVNYQVNVAYVLVFWLLSVCLAAWVMAWYQLLGLRISALSEEEHFAGVPINITLYARAQGRRRRWLWLKLGQHDVERGADWQPWVLPKTGEASRIWTLPPQPRGYLVVPLLPCVSTAPFGVMLAQSLWQYNGNAVIYPAPLAHSLPQGRPDEADKSRHRRTQSSGDDLAYLQEHRPGASLQHIAWKQYAKTGQLLDKHFDDHVSNVRQDWISYRDYPPYTAKEQLAGMLCYRVLQAEQHHHAYTLELPQQVISPGVGQRTQCLTALGLL